METYNLLLLGALECYPGDPMLLQMSTMPDRTTQSLTFGRLPKDMQGAPSQLLLERVTQLITRLEVLELPAEADQRAKPLTGWPEVDNILTEVWKDLSVAETVPQFQGVGLKCRELLISLGQKVYDPERHSTESAVTPGPTDAKEMLSAFIRVELSGVSNEARRRFVKGALDIANELEHRRTANSTDAACCVAAMEAVVSLIAILAKRQDH